MKVPHYLVRLDDACPTMKAAAWDQYEETLDRLGIRPLVAVIPDNQDPALHYDPVETGFWDRVRRWQDKGWWIGLHGQRHLLEPIRAGRPLVPLHPMSEFVGRPLELQRAQIRDGWERLRSEGILPRVWIAPAHTFDTNTLEALSLETSIRVVSDGLSRYPFVDRGFFWIPQQLWRFVPRRSGIWTICQHPSSLTEAQLKTALTELATYAPQVVSDLDVLRGRFGSRAPSPADDLYRRAFLLKRAFFSRVFGT